MVDVVATLGVDITGNSQPLANELSKSEGMLRGSAGRLSGIGSQIGTGIAQGLGISVGLGVAGVVAKIASIGPATIGMAMNFESAFAGVEKVFEGTAEELDAIRQQILALSVSDSPVAGLENAAIQLANIAEMAGQLGVAKEDVVAFSETIAMLSMTTNLAGEEGAAMLAQFANITGMDMGNIDRLGAAIVALGNDGASTEAQIVEFAHRLAGAGDQAGMTEAEILALGSAMASAGLNAEAGGTAMTTVLNKLATAAAKGGTALDTFAKVSHTSAEEFANTWRSEPTEALTMFLDGLNDLDQATQLDILEELELDGIRVSDTLRRLSGNVGLVEDALATANTAWDENTALMNEAEKRAATTEAEWNKLKNTISAIGIAIGSELLPAVNDAIDAFGYMAELGAEILGIDLDFEVSGETPTDAVNESYAGWTYPVMDASVPLAIEYTVQPGDSPWSIANAHDMTLDQFYALNPDLLGADYIYAGDKVIVSQGMDINFGVEGFITSVEEMNTTVLGAIENVGILNKGMNETASASQKVDPSKLDELNAKVSELTGMTFDLGFVTSGLEKLADLAIPDETPKVIEDIADAMGDLYENTLAFMSTGDFGESFNIELPNLGEQIQDMSHEAKIGWLQMQIDAAEAVNSIINSINELGGDTLGRLGIEIGIGEINTDALQAELDALKASPPELPIMPIVEEMSMIPPIEVPIEPRLDYKEIGAGLRAAAESDPIELPVTVGQTSYDDVTNFAFTATETLYGAVAEPLNPTISQTARDELAMYGSQIDRDILAKDDNPLNVVIASNINDVAGAIDVATRDRFTLITFRIQELGGQVAEAIGDITGLGGFAEGGRPPVGEPSIVGEEGPELFVPDSSGVIIPNHDLMGGSSGSSYGGGVTFNGPIHVYGVQDARGMYEEILNIARQQAQPGFMVEDY